MLGASVVESLGLPADPENPRCPKPTTGGRAAPVRFRRDPEDILLDAGAAIINLAHFYGPEVHVSTLQQAVVETVAGKRMGENTLSE